MATKRKEGPTPNGGAYSVIVYLNGEGEAVDKEQATRAEVVEFNRRGEAIFRTYASLKTGGENDE